MFPPILLVAALAVGSPPWLSDNRVLRMDFTPVLDDGCYRPTIDTNTPPDHHHPQATKSHPRHPRPVTKTPAIIELPPINGATTTSVSTRLNAAATDDIPWTLAHVVLGGIAYLQILAMHYHAFGQIAVAVMSILFGCHLISEKKHFQTKLCALLTIHWYMSWIFLSSFLPTSAAVNVLTVVTTLSFFVARPGYWPLLFPRTTTVTTTVTTLEDRPEYAPDWWWTVYGGVVGDPIAPVDDDGGAAAPGPPPATAGVVTDTEIISFGEKNGLGVTAKFKIDPEDPVWRGNSVRPVVCVGDLSSSMGGHATNIGNMFKDVWTILVEAGVNPNQVHFLGFNDRLVFAADPGDPRYKPLPKHIGASGMTAYNPVDNYLKTHFCETGAVVYFMTDGLPNSDHGTVMPFAREMRRDPRWTFKPIFMGSPGASVPQVLHDIFGFGATLFDANVESVKRFLMSSVGHVAPRMTGEVTVQVVARGREITPKVKVTPTRVDDGTARVVIGGIPADLRRSAMLLVTVGSETHEVEIPVIREPRGATSEEKAILAAKVFAKVQESLGTGDARRIRGGLNMINELIRGMPSNAVVETLRTTIKEMLADIESGQTAENLRKGNNQALARVVEEAADLLNFATENLGGRLKRVVGKALEKMAVATEGTDEAARLLADQVAMLRSTRPTVVTVNGPDCPGTGTVILGRAALVIRVVGADDLDKLKRELESGDATSRFWLNVASGGKSMGSTVLGVYDLEAAFEVAREHMRRDKVAVIVLPLGAPNLAPMLAGQVLYGSPTLEKNLKPSQGVVMASIAAQALATIKQVRGLTAVPVQDVTAVLSLCPYWTAIFGASKRTIPPTLVLDKVKALATEVMGRYVDAIFKGRLTLGGLVQLSTAEDHDGLMPDVLHAVVQLLWATLDAKPQTMFSAETTTLSLLYEVFRSALRCYRQNVERADGGNVNETVDKAYLDLVRACVEVGFGEIVATTAGIDWDPAKFRTAVESAVRNGLDVTVDNGKTAAVLDWIEKMVPYRKSGGGALPMVSPTQLVWIMRVAGAIHRSHNTHASTLKNNGVPEHAVEIVDEPPSYNIVGGGDAVHMFYHAYRGTGVDAPCVLTPEGVKAFVMDMMKDDPRIKQKKDDTALAMRRKILGNFLRRFADTARPVANPIKLAMRVFDFFTKIGGHVEAGIILARLTTPAMVESFRKHQGHLALVFETVTQLEFAPALIPLIKVATKTVLVAVSSTLTRNSEFLHALSEATPDYSVYVQPPPRGTFPVRIGSCTSKRANDFYVMLLAKSSPGIVRRDKGGEGTPHAIQLQKMYAFVADDETTDVLLTATGQAGGQTVVVPEAALKETPFVRGERAYAHGRVAHIKFGSRRVNLRAKAEAKREEAWRLEQKKAGHKRSRHEVDADIKDPKMPVVTNPCVVTEVLFEDGRTLTRHPDGTFVDSHPAAPLMPVVEVTKKDEGRSEESVAQKKLQDAAKETLDKLKRLRWMFTPAGDDDNFDVTMFY